MAKHTLAMEITMEYIVLAGIALAWFYSEELVSFLQLDRAARMTDRKLDRLEDEQIVNQTAYYAGKEVPSDEMVKKALEGRARMQQLRSKL